MNLEELVNRYNDKLNSTDIIIWKYIVNHKKQCCNYTIYELASACNVSRTTILRFAQKLSLSGYSELKVLLKLESQQTSNENINNLEEIARVYNHVTEEMIKKDFTKINELIYNSNNIFAYGTGSMQKNVVNELHRLFNNGGDFIINIGGPGEIPYLLKNITKDDLVILVSFNGETPQTIEFAKQLKIRDIPIISITKLKDNTLASLSNENIYISTLDFQMSPRLSDSRCECFAGYFIAIEVLFLKYQMYKINRNALSEG